MKKTIVVLVIVLIFVACTNHSRTEGKGERNQDWVISSCIIEAFEYHLRLVGDTADTSAFYMVWFDRNIPGCPNLDTMIIIGRLNTHINIDGQKGITTICNRKTVIIDEKNLGGNYYNSNLLKNIDLEGFVLPDEISYCCAYIINGCYLNIWGVPPSDYKAIRIR